MEREIQGSRIPDDMEPLIAFGELVRVTRKARGMSLRAVARQVGMSPAYLLSIERARNPKTGKPSMPNHELVTNLCFLLNIDPPFWIEQAQGPRSRNLAIQNLEKSVKGLQSTASVQRKIAADMVQAGDIVPQAPNEIFSYRLELATLYTSTAVVVEAVLEKLEKDIQELRTKYHIEEDSTIKTPEGGEIQKKPGR